MSINDKFTYLQQTKEKIKTAIQNKGVDVSDADTFRSYAEKIALIEGGGSGGSGGETTWAYHTGQAVAGDKVMLTKVNSITTSDEAFCNGFYPNYIFNGYAYGNANSGQVNATQRRQIVNGVIDSSYVSVSGTSRNSINVPHFGLNGTCCYEIALNSTSNFDVSQGFNSGRFITGTSVIQPSGQGRICLLEKYVAVLYHGSGGWNNLFKYDTGSQITTNVAGRGTNSFAFEDGSGKYVYFARDFKLSSGSYSNILRYNVETNTYDDLGLPSCTINTSANLSNYNQIFLQTKDYKYLLNVNAYIDLDIENNTYTLNDYPPVIIDAIGDRGILSIQVFYDGYFGIQLSEGTTLMCKYTNSMEDVEIKEIVEPFSVEGDSTIYYRHFSPDRLYWFIRPQYGIYSNGATLSTNPAGPYQFKQATSDYVAYTPSKDRFNSTVLTGFLTGEIKEEDGRLMVQVRTTGIDLSRKQDKFLIEELLNETTLKNNTIFRGDEMLNVELFVPEDIHDDFLCEVDFTSGETATAFTMADTVKWTGDDITDNAFVPVANKRYNLLFWYDGVNLNGAVKGFE